MAHTVDLGNRTVCFPHITSVHYINNISPNNYVFLVQNEDTIDIWQAADKVRAANDLVKYYKLWDYRDIDETDFKVVKTISF